eukprot:Lithocolla_globosa_v1_NODE_60_length_7376_cov_322.464554.p5 type:complete len:194 gc:universal NODE_60_length_7376_cov_322.464554:6560-7141(+)
MTQKIQLVLMETLVKWGKFPPNTMCKLCENARETQLHLLRDCSALQDVRNSWMQRLEETLKVNFLTQPQQKEIYRAFGRNVDSHLGALGLVTKQAKMSLSRVTNENRKKLHSLLVRWLLRSRVALVTRRNKLFYKKDDSDEEMQDKEAREEEEAEVNRLQFRNGEERIAYLRSQVTTEAEKRMVEVQGKRRAM